MKETDWFLVSSDPMIGRKTYMRFASNGELQVRETQVMSAALRTENSYQRNEWRGWHGKNIAKVASVPISEFYNMQRRAGWEPGTRNFADPKVMTRMLNDSDYREFRTGGGRL